jgi:uncharacterized membrane protein
MICPMCGKFVFMNEEEKIKQLQKQLDDLANEMQLQQLKLFDLQKELSRLQGIEPKKIHRQAARPARNFRLENFIGLRLIHFVGIVVLVIGLSIGVKYAIDQELISEVMRIALAYAAGALLFFLSWRLKKQYQLFSAILFSGAMASMYFTTYAAFVYYGFFRFEIAFLLMAVFTIYTSYEAIRYNRQEIAVLGMVGAYGIPFLISGNVERLDLFFAYILIINLGVVFLSFKRKWKVMGQLALFITWVLFILWGFTRYEEKNFMTGLVFLTAFYVLFTVNALAYRLVRSEPLAAGDIQQVLTNNIAFYLSGLIVFSYGRFDNHLAATTGGIALIILLFAYCSYLFFRSENILQQSLAMQTVVLVTMFIGFNWNGFIVTLLWVAFAILLFSWGIFTRRSWPRLASLLLMVVTLGKLMIFDASKFTTVQKIVAYMVIGTLLLILSFYYQKFKQSLFENRDVKE